MHWFLIKTTLSLTLFLLCRLSKRGCNYTMSSPILNTIKLNGLNSDGELLRHNSLCFLGNNYIRSWFVMKIGHLLSERVVFCIGPGHCRHVKYFSLFVAIIRLIRTTSSNGSTLIISKTPCRFMGVFWFINIGIIYTVIPWNLLIIS